MVVIASFASLGVAVRRWRQPRWLWLPASIAAFDLALIGWTIDIPSRARTAADLLPQSELPWVQRIRESGERLWVVTDTAGIYTDPLGKLAANVNSLAGVQSLTDYGPLQPRSLQPRFEFKPWGVTEIAERLLSDTGWMRNFNVGWVLICGPQGAPAGCDLVDSRDIAWRLYRNPSRAGMAMLENPGAPGGDQHVSALESRFQRPGRTPGRRVRGAARPEARLPRRSGRGWSSRVWRCPAGRPAWMAARFRSRLKRG